MGGGGGLEFSTDFLVDAAFEVKTHGPKQLL